MYIIIADDCIYFLKYRDFSLETSKFTLSEVDISMRGGETILVSSKSLLQSIATALREPHRAYHIINIKGLGLCWHP